MFHQQNVRIRFVPLLLGGDAKSELGLVMSNLQCVCKWDTSFGARDVSLFTAVDCNNGIILSVLMSKKSIVGDSMYSWFQLEDTILNSVILLFPKAARKVEQSVALSCRREYLARMYSCTTISLNVCHMGVFGPKTVPLAPAAKNNLAAPIHFYTIQFNPANIQPRGCDRDFHSESDEILCMKRMLRYDSLWVATTEHSDQPLCCMRWGRLFSFLLSHVWEFYVFQSAEFCWYFAFVWMFSTVTESTESRRDFA